MSTIYPHFSVAANIGRPTGSGPEPSASTGNPSERRETAPGSLEVALETGCVHTRPDGSWRNAAAG